VSEYPERPKQPGAETEAAKAAVAGLQAALDATFNAVAGRHAEQVQQELRSQLERHGVAQATSDVWVARAAERVAAGEPVVAEPGDA
jgi:hypothetical protein